MRRKGSLFIVSLLFMVVVSAYSQDKSQDFFIAPLGEVVSFGRYNIAYGGGLAVGYGTGGTVGARLLYAIDDESFIFMEVLFFARMYFLGKEARRGPFAQLNAGPVLFALNNPDISGFGHLSTAVIAGWRIPIGKNWFVEPAVRGGYPCFYGGSISTGFRTGGN